MSRYKLGSQAAADLRNILGFIAADNIDAADRVLGELSSQFARLVEILGLGHKREDVTDRGVVYWSVLSSIVVFRPKSPLQVFLVRAQSETSTQSNNMQVHGLRVTGCSVAPFEAQADCGITSQ